MIDSLLHNYAFNLSYLKMLLDGIPPERICEQPGNIANHPAWILGHLVHAADFAGMLLGLEPNAPKEWEPLFGRGVEPKDDRSAYPSIDELLAALESQHTRVTEAVQNADPEALKQPTPDEEFRALMPTVGDALVFLITNHEATHLGQLSTWRRAMGLPSVLG